MRLKIFTLTILFISIFCLPAQNAFAQWTLPGNNLAGGEKLGSLNAMPLNIVTNNTSRIYVTPTGMVGIGTNSPANILTVKVTAGLPNSSWITAGSPAFVGFAQGLNTEQILATAANLSNARSVITGRKARGTLAAPSVVFNNDYLASIAASGYDGAAFQNPALIDFYVDGTPTAGNVPARISLVTGSNIGNRAERLKVGSTGNFTFNNTQLFLQQSTGALSMGSVTPHASSILDITSSTKGVLFPRMTTSEKNAIVSPATSLLIFQTDSVAGYYYYNNGWETLSPSLAEYAKADLSNLVFPTLINADLTPANPGANSLGSTDLSWKAAYFSEDVFLAGARFLSNRGTNNSFVGTWAGNTTLTGAYNTGVGSSALPRVSSGMANTAIGFAALHWDTTGSYNTATGASALQSNGSGNFNTATGYYALAINTTGSSNTAHGYNALSSNTTAAYNTALGAQAMFSNATGFSNTATGTNSLFKNTTGSYNTAHGFETLYSNTSGTGNHAFGNASLYSNTIGSYNVAIGMQALNKNINGSSSTAVGAYALHNSTGGQNTASGANVLYNNTSGSYNTASGYQSLYSNTTGSYNAAKGTFSLFSNTTGSNNAAFGQYSLYYNATTSENTAIGYSAGDYTYTASQGTFLGSQTRASNGLSNMTAIGYGAYVTASNSVRIGNTGITSIGGQVGWTTFSDGRFKKNIKEDVPGLDFINELRPVTYSLDVASIVNRTKAVPQPQQPGADQRDVKRDVPQTEAEAMDQKSKIKYTGFIAQEVEDAAKKMNYDFSGVDMPKNDKDFYGIRYAEFVVPLVKAVQELSKKNEELEVENMDIKVRLERLEALVSSGNLNNGPTTSASLNNISLDQNNPNPYSTTTSISYNIPTSYKSAQLLVTDASGKTLKAIQLQHGGNGLVNVDASLLASGTYNYSIVVDGKLITSKKMIVMKK